MRKYFQIYEYDDNLNVRLEIYQLHEKSTLCWEEIITIRGIDEKEVSWETFQKHFKDKYFTEMFYYEKEK